MHRFDVQRGYDPVTTLALAIVASVALVLAAFLPWWTMEARAPQYGQRTLVVEVGPMRVGGDLFEVDTLGHYVGIRPMGELAASERLVAPFGMGLAVLGVLLAPWARRRWLRATLVVPAVVVPIFFIFDLQYWMNRATNERDPDASLNLTVTAIETKLFGDYEIAQFKVTAKVGGGLYMASVAGLMGLGLVGGTALPSPFRRRRRKTGAVAAATTGLILVLSATAQAKETQVTPDNDLSAAIAAAQPGDVLRLAAGVHRAHVVIKVALSIVGAPEAILDGGGEGTVVRVEAADVELRGFTIANSGSSFNREDTGVRLEGAARARLLDLRIVDTLFGIFALEADECQIADSYVRGLDLPVERRGDGIRLWHSSGCRVVGNRVERSRDVIVWYSSDTVVERNVVRASRYGLHYMYSDRNRFHHNLFEDNQVGAAIMYSRGIELSENSFSYSSGPAAYGLLLKDADDVFIRGNRFVMNATGLFFDNAPQAKDGRVEVESNLIARNDVGIALEPNVRRIRLFGNGLIGNRIQVEVLGTGSAEGNDWSVNGKGNYWSDAPVYDPDGDGISKLPVRLESSYEVLADRYTTLGFQAFTPAAEAIDMASRVFPIFQPRPKLVDEFPLTAPPPLEWALAQQVGVGGAALATFGGLLFTAAAGVMRLGRAGATS